MNDTDTIAALATVPGKSAIAVIRISGKDAFKVVYQLLDREDADRMQERVAQLIEIYRDRGDLSSSGREFIDACIVVPFAAPKSYTGEHVIEIYSHGGTIVPNSILEAVLAAGARMAEPGEFTRRAFLNNKLDLAQAESIDAITSASTKAELRLAHHQYSGQFSREVQRLRSELVDLLSLLELELDFADEDVEFAGRDDLRTRLHAVEEFLQSMVHSYERTHLVRQGVYVGIVGRPNVGKSSLLNLLLKKERAIVTDVPGTTRDILEEAIDIRGHKFVFFDTAGIRQSDDTVEREGIRRSEAVLAEARIVLLLVDQSEHLQKEDWEIRQQLLQLSKDSAGRVILIVNKTDLQNKLSAKEFASFAGDMPQLRLSCTSGQGLAELEDALLSSIGDVFAEVNPSQAVLLNLRQKDAAQRALKMIVEAKSVFESGLSQEFISVHIRSVVQALEELIGMVSTEDILGNIFANFCIGK